MKRTTVLLCLLFVVSAIMGQEVISEYVGSNRAVERVDPVIEDYKKSGLYNSHQEISARIEAMVAKNDQKGLSSFFRKNKQLTGDFEETLEQVKAAEPYFKTAAPLEIAVEFLREGEKGRTMCIFPYKYKGENKDMQLYYYSVYVVFTWLKNETQELSVSLVKMPIMEYQYLKEDKSSIRMWRKGERPEEIVDDFIQKK